MRKLTLLTGTLLAVVLAVAGGISAPQPAWAICYCDGVTPWYSTPINWGKGTSCAAAHADLEARTQSDAEEACGQPSMTCLGAVTVTGACRSLPGGMFQEDGYRLYKCKTCGPIDPNH